MFEPFETSDPITTPAGTFRVQYHYDQDAESPREWSNVGRLTIAHRNVIDPDPDGDVAEVLRHVQDGGISTRAACRYLRLVLGARVVLPVSVGSYDHTYATGDPDGGRGKGVDGFTYDTPADVRETIGEDATDDQIAAALRAEVDVYSAWASGEFVGRVIERLVDPLGEVDPDDAAATWAEVDMGAVWGFESAEAAREDAESEIRAYGPGDFLSPVLAVQV